MCALKEGKVERLFRKTPLHRPPCAARARLEGKGGFPAENWGEMFHASDNKLLACISMSLQDVCYVCSRSKKCASLLSVSGGEMLSSAVVRVAPNVPLEGRPPAKMIPFALQSGEVVTGHTHWIVCGF